MKKNAFETPGKGYQGNMSQQPLGVNAQKGFLEQHGLVLGGGVLALGMMILGSQHIESDRFSADLSEEGALESEETTAEEPQEEEVQASVVLEESEESEEIIPETPLENLESSEQITETSDAEGSSEINTVSTQEQDATQVDEAEVSASTEEASSETLDETQIVSAVSDPEPQSSATTTSSSSGSTQETIIPLYADPIETEESEFEVQAEPEVTYPVVQKAGAGVEPPVPVSLLNAPLPEEGVVEGQYFLDLTPVLPQ